MSRVTISMKAARAIDAYLEWSRNVEIEPSLTRTAAVPLSDWFELRRAMQPKHTPRKPPSPLSASDVKTWTRLANQAGVQTKAQKRERRVSVWAACWKRCGGFCECGCGQRVSTEDDAPLGLGARAEMDHFWGRGKGRPPESLETCWILSAYHHSDKTNNRPDAAAWLERFITHCSKCGYDAELRRAAARRSFVETRSMLGAGLRRTP